MLDQGTLSLVYMVDIFILIFFIVPEALMWFQLCFG